MNSLPPTPPHPPSHESCENATRRWHMCLVERERVRESFVNQSQPRQPTPPTTPTSHVRTPPLTRPEEGKGWGGGCRKFSAFLTGRDNHPRDPPAWTKAKHFSKGERVVVVVGGAFSTVDLNAHKRASSPSVLFGVRPRFKFSCQRSTSGRPSETRV